MMEKSLFNFSFLVTLKLVFCFDIFTDCRVYDEASGRQLEVYTSQRGVQFYSGNFLNTNTGKNGNQYTARTGFCLEPQGYPDNPNHVCLLCIIKFF